MDDDKIKAATALSEASLSEKLERYLARGRPLQELSDDDLRVARREGLAEWAKSPASFDGHVTIPGDDANSEMSLRGLDPGYSAEEDAIFAQAVEELMPAHDALSPKQREAASEAMMAAYRAQRAKQN